MSTCQRTVVYHNPRSKPDFRIVLPEDDNATLCTIY